MNALKDTFDVARDLRAQDLLEAFGPERKRSALATVLPGLGILVAGVLVGASVALLFAPASGRDLRRYFRGKLFDLTGQFGPSREEVDRVEHLVGLSRSPDNGASAARWDVDADALPK